MSEFIRNILEGKAVDTSKKVNEAEELEVPDTDDEWDEEDGDGIYDLEGEELLDKFIEQNEMWHFEGDSGVKNLERIMDALGYGSSYGSVLTTFLADNPGAQEAIVQFIRQWMNRNDEWQKEMIGMLEGIQPRHPKASVQETK